LSVALQLPCFYPILDAARFPAGRDQAAALVHFARELVEGGAKLIQYRNKSGNAREVLSHARELRRTLPDSVRLIMNDRVDLCLAAGFNGVHLGQDDLSPIAAIEIFRAAGKQDQLWVGFSTHNPDQLQEAERMPLSYVAVGPVFTTRSKENPDPEIGLDGVRQARRITSKPLVAIGGITRRNGRAVLEAGADSLAVISDIVKSPRKSTEEFLGILR
jgi:thiamine-phosphate pyrophosphorylase